QDLRIAGVAPGDAFDGFDWPVQGRQVQSLDQPPDQSSSMVGIEPLVERFAMHLLLEPLWLVDPGGSAGAWRLRDIDPRRFDIGFGEQHGWGIVRHEATSSAKPQESIPS